MEKRLHNDGLWFDTKFQHLFKSKRLGSNFSATPCFTDESSSQSASSNKNAGIKRDLCMVCAYLENPPWKADFSRNAASGLRPTW